ncbi:hypothetical protein PIPA1_18690 [Pelosinus sp. IPA-1]|nr:hypothetical protein PIPA1_18690 [Pelosinus sp. IPA-1]
MWRKAYNIKWTVEGKFLCVKACWEGETFFLPPFGPEEGLADVVEIMLEHAKEENFPFAFQGVEGYMVEWLEKIKPGYFSCKPERDNYDYVYLAKDLIELKGRKFHTKKNHVNSFRKTYSNYQYVPMTADMTQQCIDFMAAFTYGEMNNNDTAVIHVEKGRKEFKGVYGVINQEFCAHNYQEALYINREEDMGIEGLRKAKESYHPVKMVEKYIVKVK